MEFRKQLTAFGTILRKEFRRFIRIWVQTVVPPVIITVLYFIIFGNLIGSRVGEIKGLDYMNYIVPGLILMTVITNSYANVVSSFFSAKFQRHIEEMLVSPTPNAVILLGFLSGGVARGMICGTAVFLVSLLFAEPELHNIFVMLLVALLTSTLFALCGLINAVFAKTFDDISIVPTFVLTPLTYLGGIFYSIDMLPDFWQQFSLLNPILYMINAFRYGALGISDINVVLSFFLIIGFILVLFGVALYLFERGIGIRT